MSSVPKLPPRAPEDRGPGRGFSVLAWSVAVLGVLAAMLFARTSEQALSLALVPYVLATAVDKLRGRY